VCVGRLKRAARDILKLAKRLERLGGHAE
jgi:hypothetical protein